MRLPRFRLVALDMDGTLLDDRLQVSPRNAQAIRAGLAAGVRFVLATGRPFRSARPYAQALGLDVPLICYNGAVVREAISGAGHLLQPIPRGVAAAVAGFLEERGLYVKVYAGDVLYVSEPSAETLWFSEAYGIPYEVVGALAPFLAGAPGGEGPRCPEPPAMMVMRAEPPAVTALAAELRARWGAEIACYRPSPWGIDIVRRGVSKGRALARLAAAWGIDRREVLAVGNADNDLEMIAWAGCGVAVANASPELVAAADWVTADNNSDGVALALERFVLDGGGGALK